MVVSKKHVAILIALLSIITLVITGIPFGNFSDVAFANLYGSSSASDQGVSASASQNTNGVCIVTIDGNTFVITPFTGIGSGFGGYTVVKNTIASQNPNYRVIQINNAANTVEFEVWLNLLTGECAVRAL